MRSELLKGLRMLDLTDEKGALCGKMFADMGAEVIKVEPPQGCPTRRIPPFLDDLTRTGQQPPFPRLSRRASDRSHSISKVPTAANC